MHRKSDNNIYYLHVDYQNSLLAISNEVGQVLERRSYDAWGRPRINIDLEYNLPNPFGGSSSSFTMRGYTFHEHLEMVGLINMNGRVYDPILGRMLSPDNYVQAPNNTQSFNRYSYCVNNPLKYTDPTGDFFWTAVTGALDFVSTAFFKGGLDPTSPNTRDKAWAEFDPTAKGTKTNNAFRIDMGMFQTDSKRPWYERAGQLFLRFTWEAPQSGLGNTFSHIRNISGNVDNVDYYGGATVVNEGDDYNEAGWGLTLGNYINSKNMKASPEDGLFRHEYGHVLQSRIAGPTYLTGVGLPSIIGGGLEMFLGKSFHNHNNKWYETNANQLGERYFNKHEKETMKTHPWRHNNYPTKYKPTWYWLFGNPISSPQTFLYSLTL